MYKICLLTLLFMLPLLNNSIYARGWEGHAGGNFRGGEMREGYGDRDAYRRGYERGEGYGQGAAAVYDNGWGQAVPYTNGPEDWAAPDEENIFQQDEE